MGWKVYTKASVDYAGMTDETAALSYRVNWSLNSPATCTALVNDDSGDKSKTYDNTYLGTSAILIEQPAATEIFRGRIISAEPDAAQGILKLQGEDWLGQLNDRRVIFDTRENLGNAYREYPLRPYLSGGVSSNAVRTTDIWVDSQPDLGNWANDAYNGMKLVLPQKYLGSQTDIQYPYDAVVTPANPPMTTDIPVTGETVVDVADGSCHQLEDDVAGAYVVYYYRSLAAHSSLVGSIDKVTITIDVRSEGSFYVVGYDFTLGTYTILPDGWLILNTSGSFVRKTLELATDSFASFFDANGYARIKIQLAEANKLTEIDRLQLKVEYTVDTGHNEAHTISDTINFAGEYNRLTLGDDVEDDGFVDWWPFSITQPVTVYVLSLVGLYDELYALNASSDVTASTNYVCRHFHRETPLQILRELAKADGTDFWLDAWDGDSLDLHWNDTYAIAGAPTWSDTDILHWVQPGRRLADILNEWFIDGVVHENYKVEGSNSDAASIASYGRRTGYFNNPDIGVQAEADAEALQRVTRGKTAIFQLSALKNGFATNVLGSVVHIHSTKYSVDADYVIAEKEYDSRSGTTAFTLTPRSSLLNPPVPLVQLARRIDERLTSLESRLERSSRYAEIWS